MEHGEFYECNKCNGLGFITSDANHKTPCWTMSPHRCYDCLCDICWNLGPLDWIENIVGREKPVLSSTTTTSGGGTSSCSTKSVFFLTTLIEYYSWIDEKIQNVVLVKPSSLPQFFYRKRADPSKEVVMEHGEFYECYNCEGLGFVPFKEEAKTPCWIHRDFAKCDACRCDVCWGLGPLDWVENMVGREKPQRSYDSSVSSISCGQSYGLSTSHSCSVPSISKYNISAVP